MVSLGTLSLRSGQCLRAREALKCILCWLDADEIDAASEPVVAMEADACISACRLLARVLDDNQRAEKLHLEVDALRSLLCQCPGVHNRRTRLFGRERRWTLSSVWSASSKITCCMIDGLAGGA